MCVCVLEIIHLMGTTKETEDTEWVLKFNCYRELHLIKAMLNPLIQICFFIHVSFHRNNDLYRHQISILHVEIWTRCLEKFDSLAGWFRTVFFFGLNRTFLKKCSDREIWKKCSSWKCSDREIWKKCSSWKSPILDEKSKEIRVNAF